MTRNDDANDRTLFRIGTTGLALLVLVSALAMPVAAQEEDGASAGGMLCDDGNKNDLGNLVETWLQMMFSIGIVAALGMYQYETLVGMLTFKQSQKRYMKEKKRDVAKAAVVLLGAGPLFTIFVGTTDAFGGAGCVSFIPWA